MMTQQTPILVLKEGTQRETGRNATTNNIAAAKAVAEAVRSTLGPKGMDKMLVDSMGDVVITNDGVTILKEIDVEHPAAKMLIEIAKTQDDECGDGTTTAVIVAGELLKKSEDLIEQNVHPTIITAGYRMASLKASEILAEISQPVALGDEDVLNMIASTAMTGKNAEVVKTHLADLAYRAVKAVHEKVGDKLEVDLDNIQVEKKQGGNINDTELIEGLILDKERVHSGMPRRIENATIALVDSAMEVRKTEVDAKIQITDPSQLNKFLEEEEKMLKGMVEKVKAAGANVIICQKGIDDLAQHYLAKAGIYAVRRAKKSDMAKLAKATGGRVVTNLDDLEDADMGKAGVVEERKIGSDEMTFITGCDNPKAVSILIRGGTEHVIDEIGRAFHDALSVVSVAVEDGKISTGGGSAAIEISMGLQNYAASVGGREQMAIEAYAKAMEIVPRSLSENAGLDAINTLIDLRKAHKEGKVHAGINMDDGKIVDMKEANVIEPLRVGKQAIESATDVAIMILRIDDIIAAKGGGAPGGMPPGGGMGMPPGGMGGMDY